MRRISVSKSPTTAPSKCETSSTKPHPPKADAWPLVSLSAYQRVPSLKLLVWAGRTLRKWKDAFLAYFDTAGASNAPHRSRQRNHRTRQTHRQRLPQPHQLPAPNAPHRKRPRCLHPHSTLKSRLFIRGVTPQPPNHSSPHRKTTTPHLLSTYDGEIPKPTTNHTRTGRNRCLLTVPPA